MKSSPESERSELELLEKLVAAITHCYPDNWVALEGTFQDVQFDETSELEPARLRELLFDLEEYVLPQAIPMNPDFDFDSIPTRSKQRYHEIVRNMGRMIVQITARIGVSPERHKAILDAAEKVAERVRRYPYPKNRVSAEIDTSKIKIRLPRSEEKGDDVERRGEET